MQSGYAHILMPQYLLPRTRKLFEDLGENKNNDIDAFLANRWDYIKGRQDGLNPLQKAWIYRMLAGKHDRFRLTVQGKSNRLAKAVKIGPGSAKGFGFTLDTTRHQQPDNFWINTEGIPWQGNEALEAFPSLIFGTGFDTSESDPHTIIPKFTIEFKTSSVAYRITIDTMLDPSQAQIISTSNSLLDRLIFHPGCQFTGIIEDIRGDGGQRTPTKNFSFIVCGFVDLYYHVDMDDTPERNFLLTIEEPNLS